MIGLFVFALSLGSCTIFSQEAGDVIGGTFKEAIGSQDEAYLTARGQLLSIDKEKLLPYLERKLADPKSSPLDKLLANILKERLTSPDKVKLISEFSPFDRRYHIGRAKDDIFRMAGN